MDLMKADDNQLLEHFDGLSIEGLRRYIEKEEFNTIQSIRRTAFAVRSGYQRGHDLSFLPNDRLQIYLRLSSGQVDWDAFMAFKDCAIVDHLHKIPVPEQRKLVGGEKLPFVVLTEGKSIVRQLDPRRLDPKAIPQILDGDHIRTQEEQEQYLQSKANKIAAKCGTYKIDARRRTVTFPMGATMTKRQLQDLMKKL